MKHFCLAETDGQAKELWGFREVVKHNLQVGFCVGHKGAIVSKEGFWE